MQTYEPHYEERFADTASYPQRQEIAALLGQRRVAAALKCQYHYRLAWRWPAIALGAFVVSMWQVLPGWVRTALFLFSIAEAVVAMNDWAVASSEALIVETYLEDVTHMHLFWF